MRMYPCFASCTQYHNRKYGELYCACTQPATLSRKVSASLHINIFTIYSRQVSLLTKRHSDRSPNPWEQKDFFSIMLQIGQRYWSCISRQYANVLCTAKNNHSKSCSLVYSSHFIFILLLPLKSNVKWHFTQVHKYYFMDKNLKSVCLYSFMVYLVMLSETRLI